MRKVNQPIFDVQNPSRFSAGSMLLIAFVLMFGLFSCSSDVDELPVENNVQSGKISSVNARISSQPGQPELFLEGLQGASGSAIGPGGDLFVTQGAIGEISRIDIRTGEISTFASGLPTSLIGIGGVNDVAFIGGTAYALVTLVGPQLGGSNVDGIYRIDGPDSYTIIADIGEFALENPPDTDFFLERGLQYSMQVFRDGFLVADGHHNRVLYITTDGEISVFRAFDNIVPTGLEVSGNTVYMAEAGPTPHLPEDGKIVSFGPDSSEVTTVASGAPLLVDVEFGRGRSLFALSQGFWDGQAAGDPAEPDTGSLVRLNDEGSFDVVADGLDRPTSMEIVQNTAYIITLTGQIWTVEDVAAPPFGT